MTDFTQVNPPPRVLILDAPVTPTSKAQFNYSACVAFFHSLGCHVAEYNQNDISASHQVFRDKWDLVCLPNIQVTGDYATWQTTMGLFDVTPPCYVANMINGAASGTARGVTGILTVDTVQKVISSGLENWQGRQPGQFTSYSIPALTWDTDVTVHAQSVTNQATLISRDVSGSNALMAIGYSSQTATLAKPWLGAQWMIDQASTARAVELKSHMKKRRCLLRIDGLNDTNSKTAFDAGDLQTIYDSLISYGIKECWVADIWGSTTTANLIGSANTDVLSWYLARSETDVGSGFFRHTNHEIDVYNGVNVYDTNVEACSSDGILFDQFKGADYAYRWACDQITGYGFVLGADGYGKGYPNVQDGNDMGNPSAKFLCSNDKLYDTDGFKGGFGCHPWVSGDEDYPTPESVKVSIRHSYRWYDGDTVLAYSQDAIDPASATAIPTNWNADVVRCFINGGGIYYHPLASTGTAYFAQYADEFGQLFTSCPDVLDSGTWEDMLIDLQRGSGIWFDS